MICGDTHTFLMATIPQGFQPIPSVGALAITGLFQSEFWGSFIVYLIVLHSPRGQLTLAGTQELQVGGKGYQMGIRTTPEWTVSLLRIIIVSSLCLKHIYIYIYICICDQWHMSSLKIPVGAPSPLSSRSISIKIWVIMVHLGGACRLVEEVGQ